MSHYTPELIRNYIDDLDAVLRRAVAYDNLEKVFSLEKKRIVSFLINLLVFFANYLTVELNNDGRKGVPVSAGTLGRHQRSKVPVEVNASLVRGQE